ncbi:hypothetical protein Dcar01_01825 [Deinococcus carri]|uniref:Uncharacterized protein n=1 Tax=Deinococcus carri TaxID=1211323 RepID=A0ABP9W6W5_9DEIO
MPEALCREILRSAYATDGEALDELARRLGAATWSGLTAGLTFHEEGTGGGMGQLTAELPGGQRLLITDGEAGVPIGDDRFLLVVVDEDEQELHSVSVGE